MPLDIQLLEKVRHHPSDKIVSRCPACAASGGDKTGNHLVVFPDGRFACAAHPGDSEHRREIYRLAPLPSEDFASDDPNSPGWHDREARRKRQLRRQERAQTTCTDHASRTLARAARRRREALIEQYAWTPADVWHDSPQIPDGALVRSCPRHFLGSLFPPEAILWTGQVHQSGSAKYRHRWRTCQSPSANIPGASIPRRCVYPF